VKNNNLAFLKLYGELISKADLNARDETKNTALYYASKNGNYKMVEKLVNLGAKVDLKNEWHDTALHAAFKNRDARMVRLLIDRGADIFARNHEGMSPLYYGDE